MRAAVLGLALLQCSCGREDDGRVAALRTALDAFVPADKRSGLCLGAELTERPSAADYAWIVIPAPLPRGFEDLEPPSQSELAYDPGPFRTEPVPSAVGDWRLGDVIKDVCFEATIPIIKDDRALVSVGRMGGRDNFFLQRDGPGWRVVARTFDRTDI